MGYAFMRNRLVTFCAPIFLGVVALLSLPNENVGPFNAINPHLIAKLVLALILINLLGRAAANYFGHHAFALTGFLGGFSSSTATIAAMGYLARKDKGLLPASSTAAVLSNVATYLQLMVIIGLTSLDALMHILEPLLIGGAVATLYAILIMKNNPPHKDRPQNYASSTNPAWQALIIATGLSLMMVFVAAFNYWYGHKGINWSAAFSGFVDAHITAVSISNLVAQGQLNADYLRTPVLIALSTNTLMKLVVAVMSGGAPFSCRVIPGLVLMISATWTASLLFPIT